MRSPLRFSRALLCCLGGLIACQPFHKNQRASVRPAPILCPGIVTTGMGAFDRAPAIVAKAMSGAFVYGEQDRLLRLEGQLPGFGGLFIADSEVVVYMKPNSPTRPERIRRIVYDAYANDPNTSIRRILAPAINAKVNAARYSLSELIALQEFVFSNGGRGLVGAGISIAHNRVHVDFLDKASVCPTIAALAAKGVPVDALEWMVTGEFRF